MSRFPPRRLGAAFVLASLLCGALGLAARTSQAPAIQSPPLMIGGANFRIGMSRQEAMALSAECCRTSLEGETGMVLHQKTGDLTIIGTVFFANGRVSGLVADVKQTLGRDASDFALALYRSILNGRTTVQGAVTIQAFPDELSNGTNRHILLIFPDGRKLRVKQFTVDNGLVGAEITEER